MKKIIINILIITFTIISLFFYIAFAMYWFNNPEVTSMQLFLLKWKLFAFGLFFSVIAYLMIDTK